MNNKKLVCTIGGKEYAQPLAPLTLVVPTPDAFGASFTTLPPAVRFPEHQSHPDTHGDLAEQWIAAASEESPVVVVTTSEVAILRLLRRIREGTLALENVAIYILHKAANWELISAPITGDGDFEIQWPQGFFEGRFAEYPWK